MLKFLNRRINMTTQNQEWLDVLAVDEVPLLGARIVQGAAAGPVAVFRNTENEIFALLDRCPHKAGPLSQGIVCGRKVTCPLHAWQIGLQTGLAEAPDEGHTRRFNVKIEAGRVYLNRAELLEI
jgi:nitrite reductase (NADH) small subunit